ncbi:AAA family ATPase [Paracoccus sp. MBLB3053]|uniref:AAA family ATPase n=1 Tax=Paracoccus aurantius TaxID=3073814 RepID=A0ABU2HXU4_9RHOB|nr:AAA family ATPase [Paracoccus sp. MBLB3053]MDS9469861.1 AAA family ATPase [Paracoccus sp. MBLB3053]
MTQYVMPPEGANRHVILSGCSGGGKSTLLAALGRRGYATVSEPGRRIVAEELRGKGRALPWIDPEAFARRAIALALADRERLKDAKGWVFFDRGLIDAAVALEHAAGTPASEVLRGTGRFHGNVFLTPPWPEIYATDDERQHDLGEAVAEYHRLVAAYRRLGYAPITLPKIGVEGRADFVLDRLA